MSSTNLRSSTTDPQFTIQQLTKQKESLEQELERLKRDLKV